MAEAIVRVQRAATDIAEKVEDVRKSTAAALAELKAVDPQVAKAVAALERYQDQPRRGKKIDQNELATYDQLTKFAEKRTAAAMQQPVSTVNPAPPAQPAGAQESVAPIGTVRPIPPAAASPVPAVPLPDLAGATVEQRPAN